MADRKAFLLRIDRDVLVPRKGNARDRIVRTLPFIGALAGDPEHTVTYVCANGQCRQP